MSSCIIRCIDKVVEKYCHCVPDDYTSQNIAQNHSLPFCTADHFINCEENEAETKKCQSEQCPINCDQEVYELVPSSLLSESLVHQLPEDDPIILDLIWLQLIVMKNYRYPVYAEVYTQTWESFLGELGELRDTFEHNNVG